MVEQCARHIALFVPDLGGGGAERVVLAEAQALDKAGHKVDLILAFEGGALLPLLPPAVRVIELKSNRLARSLPGLAAYLRRERPDALHATMWPSTVIAVIAHRMARSKARLVVSDQVALSRLYVSGFARAAVRVTTSIFYRLADHRICCSAAAADDLAMLSGLDRESIEVIHNPIETPKDMKSTAEIRALWGSAKHRLINVGTLKDQKNQKLLLRSFARSQVSDTRLVIVGEGPLRPELEALATELGIADRVAFAGFNLDPWPYYAASTVFILSSDYEGFANVVAEALYAGLTVISTDCVAGPREILADGEFGRLVPVGSVDDLAQAIKGTVTEKADVQRLRQRAIDMAGPQQSLRYVEILTG